MKLFAVWIGVAGDSWLKVQQTLPEKNHVYFLNSKLLGKFEVFENYWGAMIMFVIDI